jgi:hypothetical protein
MQGLIQLPYKGEGLLNRTEMRIGIHYPKRSTKDPQFQIRVLLAET